MRKTVLMLTGCCFCLLLKAQNTDLPGPAPNLYTLPSGSYVVAMDNTLQANSAGKFNLKAYGLIVYLLNHNVRVRWSIKAGKAKDGVDFTATAEQIKPTLAAGAVSRSFKAGPFVIFAADTSGVASLVDAFYTANSLTGGNRPRVYRLTADAPNTDIRYDLAGFRPKAAILTDGGNQNIHLDYMTAASIPSESYATSQGTDLISNCFTFASEPHNKNTGPAVNAAISAIRDFVTKGGNFLAQCEAISNYENNPLGRFQTTGGINVTNTNIGTTLSYANPDLSFSQIEGSYDASQGGSVKNWEVVGTTANNYHDHATGTGTNAGVIGASVSKHFYAKGGLVFYIGNHSFSSSTPEGINGIRMYMNAFLTPSNTNCPILVFSPLDVKLLRFSGTHQNGLARLSWSVAGNETVRQFSVERSTDGAHFTPVTVVPASNRPGEETYQFSERQNAPKSYYRLNMADRKGSSHYSAVLSFSEQPESGPFLRILNSPRSNDLPVLYFSNQNVQVQFHLYNSSGFRVYTLKARMLEGMNRVSIPAGILKSKDLYFLEAVNQDHYRLVTKFTTF